MEKKMVRARGKKGHNKAPDCGDGARPGKLVEPRPMGRILDPNVPLGSVSGSHQGNISVWPCGAVLATGSDGRVVDCRTPFHSKKSPCPFVTRSEIASIVVQLEEEIRKINRMLDAFSKWTESHDEQVLASKGVGLEKIRNRPGVACRYDPENDGDVIRGQVPDEEDQSFLDDSVVRRRGSSDE